MLRVRTIFAGSAQAAAAYYTRYLTEAPGEVPGMWSGEQAAVLGLAGDVSGGDLLALLEGRDPVSGMRLGRALEDRYRADGTVVRAVAGFDVEVVFGAEVAQRVVGVDPRRTAARRGRRCRSGRSSASGAVRRDDVGSHSQWTSVSRFARADDGAVSPDDVAVG